MRNLSRLLALTLLAVASAVPSASAASTAFAKVSPNNGGTSTVATPTTFSVSVNAPDMPYDPSGATRIKAIVANLPEQLLFNTSQFRQCEVTEFVRTHRCPAATKIGSAAVEAYSGPEVRMVLARAELYFGNGFSVLTRITADSPAVVDSVSVGELRSTKLPDYGLQMYIPVPADVSEPIDLIYPVIRTVAATFKPPTRTTRLPGSKRRVRVPLAGIGPCTGPLNFQINIVYTDALGLIDKLVDGASTTARCRK